MTRIKGYSGWVFNNYDPLYSNPDSKRLQRILALSGGAIAVVLGLTYSLMC